MSVTTILTPSQTLSPAVVDFAVAPFDGVVLNPLKATLQCGQFEVQNSSRVNTGILETEQIQLKPGSLLTSITLGESILATAGCDFINFTKAGAVSLGCGAAAQLTVGNPAEGAGMVFDTAANTVTVTGPLTASLARSGIATVAAAAQFVNVPLAGLSDTSIVSAQIQLADGAVADATALYVTHCQTHAGSFDIYVNAAATADVTVSWAVLKL